MGFTGFSPVFLTDGSNAAEAEVQIPNCPDANGVLRGHGKLLTAQSATEFEITGYVTDAAELSHFDMTGATSETLTGGGRSRRISVRVETNRIGTEKSADRIGKITFADADPQMAEVLNDSPKVVVSKSLQDVQEGPHWKNVTLLRGLDRDEILELKKKSDITILGSGTIVQQLANLGLIDSYQLVVVPLVLGNGKRLFQDVNQTDLKLADSRSFKNGLVVMQYEPR
jgi:dihydrofolate reductase